MEKQYIAVDLGASNGRVVVGNLEKFTVTNRFVTRNEMVNGAVHWDILYIFAQIKKGIKEAFRLFPEPGAVASISIDTWGVDFGLLDAAGQLIGLPYHYRDSRTDGMMEEVFSVISKEEIYRETGGQFMQINTLYQLVSMKKNHPELFAAARRYLSIPDLLSFWLSGVMANEYSHASTTQLYNPSENQWSWKIIDALSFDRSLFGEVVKSGTVLGPLTEEVRDELGASRDTVVIAGASHDTAAAVAAVPVTVEEPVLYLSSGTWSLLGTESPEPIISEKSLEYNFTNEGAASGGIRFLKNIMGMWIQQETLRWWESHGQEIPFRELDAETLDLADFPSVIDPNDERFLKPNSTGSPMPERIEDYCREQGMQVPEKPGEFMATIYRGLAAIYARYTGQIEKITGITYRQIYIIGGGSKNGILNQWTADVTGKKVGAGPVEATALGNILIQALALGDIPDRKTGRKIIRDNHEYQEYMPENR